MLNFIKKILNGSKTSVQVISQREQILLDALAKGQITNISYHIEDSFEYDYSSGWYYNFTYNNTLMKITQCGTLSIEYTARYGTLHTKIVDKDNQYKTFFKAIEARYTENIKSANTQKRLKEQELFDTIITPID